MKPVCLAIAICFVMFTVRGQIIFPALSSKGSMEQVAGFTTIRIDYERPSARGRKVFGDLVALNKLWRTGAGRCTRISFDSPVRIHQSLVSAGTYSLFSIPNTDKWTVILNRDTLLEGVSGYDSTKDVLRFTVVPEYSPRFYESLNFDVDVIYNDAKIYLSWENTCIQFAVQTLTDEKVMNSIRENLLTGQSDNWNEYAGAVEYYLFNNKDLNEALQLAEATILRKKEIYPLVLRIQVLERQQNYAAAIQAARAALEFVRKEGPRLGYSVNEIKSLEYRIAELTRKSAN